MKKLFLALFCVFVSSCSFETITSGERGVKVKWGIASDVALSPGIHFEAIGTNITPVSIQQQKQSLKAACFSSDLQEISMDVSVLFRVPEANVVKIFTDFHGQPFDVLVAPRIQESIKEATSGRSAEMIIKQREAVKTEALQSIHKKLEGLIVVEDIVIEDIGLSKQLSAAIEAKMIQEQEAAKAKYTTQKAEEDAETARATARGEADSALIKAKAEAESIRIRGDALRQSPGVVQLQLIEKWDGKTPQIVGGGSGMQIIMPATSKE